VRGDHHHGALFVAHVGRPVKVTVTESTPVYGAVRILDAEGRLLRVIPADELRARKTSPVPTAHAPIVGPNTYPYSTVAPVKRTRRV
jgi:hypothetical protein